MSRSLASISGRPVSLAGERHLEVPEALAPAFPDGGMRRGTTVTVAGEAKTQGVTLLAMALLADVTRRGKWAAVVGLPSLGLMATAQAGVALEHLALVPQPGSQWPEVTAALLDSAEAVLLRVPGSARLADARRLVARARQRGSVLLVLGPWPEAPDITLAVSAARWSGLGTGYGHLVAREVEVVASGRRAASRPVPLSLWLPAADGTIRAASAATSTDVAKGAERGPAVAAQAG